MEENQQISLDKLRVKRLEAIEENGLERFPTDVGYDKKRVSLIRRIDFTWAIEEEGGEGEGDEKGEKKTKKKQKKESASTPWPWQSMLENLQLAQQESSVIIDLINTLLSPLVSNGFTPSLRLTKQIDVVKGEHHNAKCSNE